MHSSALINAKLFFDTYFEGVESANVLDIGSQDVNGSIRHVTPNRFNYVGVDFVAGKGVDIIIDDPYVLPFDNDSMDIVVSNSCFEHSQLFWVLFLEILRVLKPSGLLYLNAPSNGDIHRYPVDCWRFYPDCGHALVVWAKRNGRNAQLLESYVSDQRLEPWNDFVGVFLKDESFAAEYPNRICHRIFNFCNGRTNLDDGVIQPKKRTEDQSNISYRLKRMRWKVRALLGRA